MFKRWINEYININKKEILTIICLLILGGIIGTIYMFISPEVKQVAVTSVKEVFDISKSETYISTNIILNGIKVDIILILILGILSVTLFGKIVIYLILLLKGVALSLYTIILFNIFGPIWGIVTFILLVVLVNIIYLPALIYLTVCFLEVNFNIFRFKSSNVSLIGINNVFWTIVISFVLMFSSIIVEQIVSSIVLNIYSKI